MARESKDLLKKRVAKVIKTLRETYPEAHCALDHKNAFELLIATILSAQCTDARVNMTTPALFAKYRSPQELAKADVNDLEILVKSTGFYKNKAKNIKACAQAIVEKHKGEVPRTLEELTGLPGVGRKTANVVLGNIYDVPSLVVDTHVTRLSNRLGFAKGEDAVKLEFQLMEVVSKEDWTDFAHLLISHGRVICVARRPKCLDCPVNRLCPKKGVKL